MKVARISREELVKMHGITLAGYLAEAGFNLKRPYRQFWDPASEQLVFQQADREEPGPSNLGGPRGEPPQQEGL